jgi:cyclopropane-fatty-acyl-phospholipid synthase
VQFGASSLVPAASARTAGLVDRWALSAIVSRLGGAAFRLQLWDGTARSASPSPSVATVTVADRGTLLGLMRRPALAFGEAYAEGRIAVHGDLVPLLESINRALADRPYQRGGQTTPRTDPAAARQNIHAHYDLGNDFYRLWLDEQMVYTCAYFASPDDSLESAQVAKLDYVCRKLRLQPGETVVEAGCGWGALALHMARHYGVTVRAFNISGAQLEYARARAAREGLTDRVTFVDGDYRTIDGRADAFVSIGMLEHVGSDHYDAIGRVIEQVINPVHGRALIHFIGRNRPMPFNPWIGRYIFPGAHAPSLGEVLPAVAEAVDLSVVDVENLRPHYAETLRHWRERFETHVPDITVQFDERFVRMWRLYLAGAEACFRSGHLQLFQIVLGRATDNTAPWTRAGLYA